MRPISFSGRSAVLFIIGILLISSSIFAYAVAIDATAYRAHTIWLTTGDSPLQSSSLNETELIGCTSGTCYLEKLGPTLTGDTRNLALVGNYKEILGNRLNFYVLNSTEFQIWRSGTPLAKLYPIANYTDRAAQPFSIPLTRKDLDSAHWYFVMENSTSAGRIDVQISVKAVWEETMSVQGQSAQLLQSADILATGLAVIGAATTAVSTWWAMKHG